MSGEYTGSLEDLTPLQQRNLLAFRIRKLLTKQAYGDKVVITTPESEVLDETHPMALPLSDINSNKQVVMKFDTIKEFPDGTKVLEHEREDQPLTDTAEDLVTAMKRTLDELEAALKPNRTRKKPVQKQAKPAAELMDIIAPDAKSAIGTVISRDEAKEIVKETDKNTKIKELINCLLDY